VISVSGRFRLFALLLVTLACLCSAQEQKDNGVRVTGKVTIGLVVTSQGLPKDEHVIHGIEAEVDRAALAAVKQWRFAPAKKNDKPIAVRVALEIEFHSM
jgi:TonB family protein